MVVGGIRGSTDSVLKILSLTEIVTTQECHTPYFILKEQNISLKLIVFVNLVKEKRVANVNKVGSSRPVYYI